MKNILTENFTKIIIAIIVAVSGAIGGDVLGYWDLSSKRDFRRNEINYRDNIDCITTYEKKIRDLSQIVSDLKNRMILLELTKLPIPFWEKDIESNHIYINEKGKKVFLDPFQLSASKLLGSNGSNMFNSNKVDGYIENDKEVIKLGKLMVFLEYSPASQKGWSFKAPIKTKFGGVVGTMGFWIDDYYIKRIKEIEQSEKK